MPFIDVWIHAVWSTYNRRPLLVSDIRKSVFSHIKENAESKNIYVDRANGYHDHVHVIFSLPGDSSISKVVQLLKGESSYWINRQGISKQKFEWQSDYYAASVSEPHLRTLQSYVDRQEEHHATVTFMEEYTKLIQAMEDPNSCIH